MKRAVTYVVINVVLVLAIVAPQATSQDRCQIDQGIRDLMNDTFGRITQTPGGGTKKVYVSNLSFLDGVSKMQFLTEEGKLIDEAVADGMKEAADTDPNIIVNDPQHTIPNTQESIDKLIDIWFHPKLSQDEKYAQAVSDLMAPYSVDILVTGMIIDTGTAIQVSPMGVSQPDKKIVTKNLRYANRAELFQEVDGDPALTQKAHEEIRKAVKDILADS
jgi:hypothetical protein